MSLKSRVISSADQLTLVAGTILVVSIIGAVGFLAAGFFPVCPPDKPDCSDSSRGLYNGPLFFGIAVAQLLFVWLMYSFASAFAAALSLKAAESSLVEPELKQSSTKQKQSSTKQLATKIQRSDSKKLASLSEDQLTEWFLSDQPPLSDWDEDEVFQEWLKRQVKSEN